MYVLLKIIKITIATIGFFIFAIVLLIYNIITVPIVYILYRFDKKYKFILQVVNHYAFRFFLFMLSLVRLFRISSVTGNVNFTSPKVVIANHPGFFDGVIIISLIKRVSVLVNGALVRKGPFYFLFKFSGYIVSSGIGESPLSVFRKCENVVRKNHNLLLFPEGTRSLHNELHKFKLGAFLIAENLGVEIQPVFIRHERPLFPKGQLLINPPAKCVNITVEFLAPIPAPKKGEAKKVMRICENLYRDTICKSDQL
ncbi:MAG: lysophospholipid acyltransferase family protein [Spirochaetes bacterium]|jgi:1-acyl-sn-glycerol-3-phosphate acyltransferase|nr:lysophospholipid acyltransferase family protein [Spirochaetota bacterium]